MEKNTAGQRERGLRKGISFLDRFGWMLPCRDTCVLLKKLNRPGRQLALGVTVLPGEGKARRRQGLVCSRSSARSRAAGKARPGSSRRAAALRGGIAGRSCPPGSVVTVVSSRLQQERGDGF